MTLADVGDDESQSDATRTGARCGAHNDATAPLTPCQPYDMDSRSRSAMMIRAPASRHARCENA